MTDPAADPAPATEGQIQAMVSLLDDGNPKVVQGCVDALVAAGERATPLLEERLETARGRVDRRVRGLLAAIRFPDADRQLLAHLRGPADLERGCLLVARLLDGGPDPEAAAGLLDGAAERVDRLLQGESDPWQQWQMMRRVLGRELQLEGVPPGQATPLHALLHGVTTLRQGMPLPLCMAWLAVARRLGVPVVGVNMPGHFLLRLDIPERFIVFDAYHGGALVDVQTCERQLRAHNIPPARLVELDADDREMLLRTLRNLVHLTAKDGDTALARRCTRLLRQAMVPPPVADGPA